MNPCNHPTPKTYSKVLIHLQTQLKVDDKIKMNPCNHPTPKVLIYLQKVLKNGGKDKIDKCNHPTPEVLNSLQKVLKNEADLRGFTMGTPWRFIWGPFEVHLRSFWDLYLYSIVFSMGRRQIWRPPTSNFTFIEVEGFSSNLQGIMYLL